MANEIEMKFKVADFTAIRKALRTAGGQYRGTVLQTDRYFDTPDKRLLAGDCGLRIRATRYLRSTVHHRDLRPLLTYKGPTDGGGRAKIRREIQTRLDDADAIAEIIQACGMTQTMVVQKRRTTYKLPHCLVELDELPLIGRFVEIEASSEAHIERAMKKLAIEAAPSDAHYIDLLASQCKRVGIDCHEITFAGCDKTCAGQNGCS